MTTSVLLLSPISSIFLSPFISFNGSSPSSSLATSLTDSLPTFEILRPHSQVSFCIKNKSHVGNLEVGGEEEGGKGTTSKLKGFDYNVYRKSLLTDEMEKRHSEFH